MTVEMTLMQASGEGNTVVVGTLIANGADVNELDKVIYILLVFYYKYEQLNLMKRIVI